MGRIQADFPSTPSALFSSSALDSAFANGEPALLTSPRGLEQATMGMQNLKVVRPFVLGLAFPRLT